MDFSFDEPEFLDPADWNLASYTHHPVDDLEPLPDHSSSYRDAALECMKILRSVDVFMSRSTDPRLAWITVSIAIGLNSTAELSQAAIAKQIGVTEQSVRRAVGKFTRLANLDPGGLRALGQVRSNGGSALKENGRRGI
jgi:hypothetical protein